MPARILIVEDDAASRELLRLLLTAAGHETLLAADGSEGIRVAIEQRPDLILCDLQMPAADGFAVLRALVAHPDWRRVPVLAVTAFSMLGDRESALAAGFAGYISKPIEPEEFVNLIEQSLDPQLRSMRSRR